MIPAHGPQTRPAIRIVEKHSLSTGASREAPVDKHAYRLNASACGPELVRLYVRSRM